MVEIEITGMAITAQYGTLTTGAILRTSAEFAKHLVEDCAAAKYTQPRQPTEQAAALESVPIAKGRAKK